MGRLFLIVLVIFCGSAVAAVYRWVDQKTGVVHYSDQPDEVSAEKIVLPEPTVYSPRRTPTSTAGGGGTRSQNLLAGYTAFSIVAPSNRSTTRSGSVEVIFQASPRLQRGHYIQVVLNGRIMDRRLTGSTLFLEGLDRGSYTVHATVHNAVGLVQIRSNIIQFFVRRESMFDDGEAPDSPDSGSSDQSGVDAPQYKPGDPVDFDTGDGAAQGNDSTDFTLGENTNTPRVANPAYTPSGGSNPFPVTPGGANPAFKPNY